MALKNNQWILVVVPVVFLFLYIIFISNVVPQTADGYTDESALYLVQVVQIDTNDPQTPHLIDSDGKEVRPLRFQQPPYKYKQQQPKVIQKESKKVKLAANKKTSGKVAPVARPTIKPKVNVPKTKKLVVKPKPGAIKETKNLVVKPKPGAIKEIKKLVVKPKPGAIKETKKLVVKPTPGAIKEKVNTKTVKTKKPKTVFPKVPSTRNVVKTPPKQKVNSTAKLDEATPANRTLDQKKDSKAEVRKQMATLREQLKKLESKLDDTKGT